MARLTENGISGAVGPVVYYSIKGRNFIRTRPAKGSKKRKKSPQNILFRSVTKNGSPMVLALRKLDNPAFTYSLATYNNIRGWIRNLHAIHTSQAPLMLRGNNIGNLNPDTDLRDHIPMLFEMEIKDRIITLKCNPFNPALEIRSPVNTTRVRMKASVITSPYNDPCFKRHVNVIKEINYSDAVISDLEFVLDAKAEAGEMAMVVISMEFLCYGERDYVKEVKWLPSAVIAMGRV